MSKTTPPRANIRQLCVRPAQRWTSLGWSRRPPIFPESERSSSRYLPSSPPNSPAESGTGLQMYRRSASIPFGEGPPAQESQLTQLEAGPLSVSSLFSPPGLSGRPQHNTLEGRSSSLKSQTSRMVRGYGVRSLADYLGKVACARGSNQCALTVCPDTPNVNRIPPRASATAKK